MSDAPAGRERARRSFLEAPPSAPFLKTPEGKRLVFLALLLAIAVPTLYFQYRKAEARVAEAEAKRALAENPAVPAVPLEERLAAKREALATMAEGAFTDTANGDDFAETAGYHKLIELLASSTPEQVTAKSGVYLDHAAAMGEPDLVRGEFVHVRGLLGGLFAAKLASPEHGISDIWRGTVSLPDGESEVIVFDLIGDPPPVELRRSVVEVDGLFYRTVAYEAKTGKKRSAPYLLARNLRVMAEEAPSGNGAKFLAIAVGIGLIIGYLILRSSLRSRKREVARPNFRQMFEHRRRGGRAEPRP